MKHLGLSIFSTLKVLEEGERKKRKINGNEAQKVLHYQDSSERGHYLRACAMLTYG